MSCMCGDLYCPSCGPAQGNAYCPHCGSWSGDGGCSDPAKCAQAEKECMEAYARMCLEEKIWEIECKKRNCEVWEIPEHVLIDINEASTDELHARIANL